MPFKLSSCFAMKEASPDFSKPAATAKPPPNKRTMSQGILTAVFQSRINIPFFQSAGIVNKRIVPSIAITVSLTPFKPGNIDLSFGENIHKKPTSKNTTNTIISCLVIGPIFLISYSITSLPFASFKSPVGKRNLTSRNQVIAITIITSGRPNIIH